MINQEDVYFVFSGGSSNSNPLLSLGGDPSSVAITSIFNNLFNNVTETQSNAGYTDYRCCYVLNSSSTETLYNIEIFLEKEILNGSDVLMGINKQNEIQNVLISGDVTGGSITFSFLETNFVVIYNSDISVFASNFQTAINAISGVSGITVSGQSFTNSTSFDVTFAGDMANKYYSLIELVTNNLTPSGSSVVITRTVAGSPINYTFPLQSSVTADPNITFTSPTIDSTITLGDLQAGDYFYIWLKRITAPGTAGISSDGVDIGMFGRPF